MKPFRDRAAEAADTIFRTLDIAPDAAQRAAALRTIEQQLVATSIDTQRWCADHVRTVRPIDRDTCRRYAETLQAAHAALIANLSSLR